MERKRSPGFDNCPPSARRLQGAAQISHSFTSQQPHASDSRLSCTQLDCPCARARWSSNSCIACSKTPLGGLDPRPCFCDGALRTQPCPALAFELFYMHGFKQSLLATLQARAACVQESDNCTGTVSGLEAMGSNAVLRSRLLAATAEYLRLWISDRARQHLRRHASDSTSLVDALCALANTCIQAHIQVHMASSIQ